MTAPQDKTLLHAEIIPIEVALERFPQFQFGEEAWEASDLANTDVVYLQGDYCLDASWDKALEYCWWERRVLLVEGNLQINARTSFKCWVTGDLRGDVLYLHRDDRCLGSACAKHFAVMQADDDEAMRDCPPIHLCTPYLFSWFYHIDALTWGEPTVVFIMSTKHFKYLDSLSLPVIPWHDARFVLKEALQQFVDSAEYSVEPWCLTRLAEACARGESILQDGVTLAGLQACQPGYLKVGMRDYPAAWPHFRAAASLAPGYYMAYHMMGRCLDEEDALAQALPYWEKAAALYPARQFCLLNEAAMQAILTACWLGEPEHALMLAERYIPLNQHYKLLRARAEALLMVGRLDEAVQDLEVVLQHNKHYGAALWLRGLAAWQSGAQDQAALWQQQAANQHASFIAGYECYRNTAFLAGTPVRVDWAS